jgi:hypothetical protein
VFISAALMVVMAWLQRRTVRKVALRACTRRGELERLLLRRAGGTDAQRRQGVAAVRRCLLRSKAAAAALARCGVFASAFAFDEAVALEALAEAKQLSPAGRAALAPVLRALNGTNAGAASILARRAKFEWGNPAHEGAARALWAALKPGERWAGEGVRGEHWKELGFQGLDPATDFRGAGTLALSCLVAFAERHPRAARRMSAEARSPQHWHPFAVTGINVTAALLDLLRARCLDRELLDCGGVGGGGGGDDCAAVAHFYELFGTCFARLHTSWVRLPDKRDIMCFPPVLAAFKARLVRELDAGDGRLAPRSTEEEEYLAC